MNLRFRCVIGGAVLAASCVTAEAGADATLSQKEPTAYYVLHGGIAWASFVGAGVLNGVLTSSDDPPRLRSWFGFEESVNHNLSATAASWSDRLAFTAIAGPVFAEIGAGVDTQLGNHAVVYGEVMGFQTLLDVAVKHAVRRARPYTNDPDPRVQEFARTQGADANLSFYSGHASAAFAAALSGSYLFAARTEDAWPRRIVWFSGIGLATATAHLRVRAGMHYYSDVIAGALIGGGIGLLVPYLHGERVHIQGGEYAAAGAGFALGAVLPLFVRTTDVRLPWGESAGRLQVAPWMPPGGAGIAVAGTL